MINDPIKGEIWINYLQEQFLILEIALNTEFSDYWVVYKNLDTEQVLVTDLDVWHSDKFLNGQEVKRFRKK